jgi:deoxyadenosine/deoxycytidine kinase
MKIISIDGNIGSGKSTLLNILKTQLVENENVIFLREPVDIWESIVDENGTNIIEKFYEDQSKYAFSFQLIAYISRLALLKEAVEKNPDKIIITERSLFTDKYVFAKMLYDSEKIEHINYKIYLQFFDTFVKDYGVDKILYIKADPEKCSERILKRGRSGEQNIPLEYLRECDTYHNEMIDHADLKNAIKIVIDGNIDIYEHSSESIERIEKIKKYILDF